MKKMIYTIAVAALLIFSTACSSKTENDFENSGAEIAETSEALNVAENRFLDYDFSVISSPVKLNEAAVPIKSELPMGYQHAEFYEPQSIDDIMNQVSQVNIITITGSESFRFLTGDSDLDNMIAEKSGTQITITGTVFEARVLYSLAGEYEQGQTIKIYYPTGDWGVEFIEGRDYLVTLTGWGDSYKLARDMNSVFNIDENFEITSQSSMPFPAKFNGLSLADASYLLCNALEPCD